MGEGISADPPVDAAALDMITLTPNIPEANAIVAKEDAAAFWAAIIAEVPIPAGKTIADVIAFSAQLNQDPAKGTVAVKMRFK